MDTENRIIDRVRKLLNLAANDAATDGEIRNAMEAANALILKYQIDKRDLEAGPDAQPAEAHTNHYVSVGGKRCGWLGTLASAVAIAVGSIGVYQDSADVPSGTFGSPKRTVGYRFYGLEADVALAAELFAEWRGVIATIATGRYGSPTTGAGLDYARGFAVSLYNLAQETYRPSRTARPRST